MLFSFSQEGGAVPHNLTHAAFACVLRIAKGFQFGHISGALLVRFILVTYPACLQDVVHFNELRMCQELHKEQAFKCRHLNSADITQ